MIGGDLKKATGKLAETNEKGVKERKKA